MSTLARELFLFLRTERKWWLAPMLVVMAVVAGVALFAMLNPGLAPLLYPLV